MNFEAALTHELKTITTLNNRIYPLTAPEQPFDISKPYLIYGSSEGLRDKTLGGYLDSKQVRAEINVIAKRYSDVKAITASVMDLLIGMEGRVIGITPATSPTWSEAQTAWEDTGQTWDGYFIGPHIDELVYEPPVELYESQPKLYRCVIDFEVYFK